MPPATVVAQGQHLLSRVRRQWALGGGEEASHSPELTQKGCEIAKDMLVGGVEVKGHHTVKQFFDRCVWEGMCDVRKARHRCAGGSRVREE